MPQGAIPVSFQRSAGTWETRSTGGPSPCFCTRLPPPPIRNGPKAPRGGGGGGGFREGRLGGGGGGGQEGRLGGAVQVGRFGVVGGGHRLPLPPLALPLG